MNTNKVELTIKAYDAFNNMTPIQIKCCFTAENIEIGQFVDKIKKLIHIHKTTVCESNNIIEEEFVYIENKERKQVESLVFEGLGLNKYGELVETYSYPFSTNRYKDGEISLMCEQTS